jgi:hypothetical protein
MQHAARSIRTFLGAKDFSVSRAFYSALGFSELTIDPKFSYFKVSESIGFYLQDYYVKDWIENTMVFLEVDDVSAHFAALNQLSLTTRFSGVKVIDIKRDDWGREYFVHDPAGVLWHFGEFKS